MRQNTLPYPVYERGLPQKGNFILGQKKGNHLIVYQAFNKQIADYALKHQRFGGNHYSLSRMTWIKPNFLWMMYRSGWAKKENQARILAISITMEGFRTLLDQAVHTSFIPELYPTQENWKNALENSEVRIQWDPDHNPLGEKLSRKAIQIGFKGKALQQFNEEFVVKIEDITDFVLTQSANIHSENETFYVPYESIIEMDTAISQKIGIDESFIHPNIQALIQKYEHEGEISEADFMSLLLEDAEEHEGINREYFIDYIRNYQNIDFSRYLLTYAILERQKEEAILRVEDLLMFSFFASKNHEAIDLELIIEARSTDFDTWCGFDGEMVFYPLGRSETLAYLHENRDKFPESTIEFYSDYTEEYLAEIHSRAFWYL